MVFYITFKWNDEHPLHAFNAALYVLLSLHQPYLSSWMKKDKNKQKPGMQSAYDFQEKWKWSGGPIWFISKVISPLRYRNNRLVLNYWCLAQYLINFKVILDSERRDHEASWIILMIHHLICHVRDLMVQGLLTLQNAILLELRKKNCFLIN